MRAGLVFVGSGRGVEQWRIGDEPICLFAGCALHRLLLHALWQGSNFFFLLDTVER